MSTAQAVPESPSPRTAAWIAVLASGALLALLYGPVHAVDPDASLAARLEQALGAIRDLPAALEHSFVALTWKPIGIDGDFDASRPEEGIEPPFAQIDERGTYRAVAHDRAYLAWIILTLGLFLQLTSAVLGVLIGHGLGATGPIAGFLLGWGTLLLVLVGFDLWATKGTWSALLDSFHGWAWPGLLIVPGLAAWSSQA